MFVCLLKGSKFNFTPLGLLCCRESKASTSHRMVVGCTVKLDSFLNVIRTVSNQYTQRMQGVARTYCAVGLLGAVWKITFLSVKGSSVEARWLEVVSRKWCLLFR